MFPTCAFHWRKCLFFIFDFKHKHIFRLSNTWKCLSFPPTGTWSAVANFDSSLIHLPFSYHACFIPRRVFKCMRESFPKAKYFPPFGSISIDSKYDPLLKSFLQNESSVGVQVIYCPYIINFIKKKKCDNLLLFFFIFQFVYLQNLKFRFENLRIYVPILLLSFLYKEKIYNSDGH